MSQVDSFFKIVAAGPAIGAIARAGGGKASKKR